MISILNAKAWAVKTFFNFWGQLGGAILNFGCLGMWICLVTSPYGPGPERTPGHRKTTSQLNRGHFPVLVCFHGGDGSVPINKSMTEYSRNACAKQLSRLQCKITGWHQAAGFLTTLQDAAHAIGWIRRNLANTVAIAQYRSGRIPGARIASWYACTAKARCCLKQVSIDSAKPGCRSGLLLFTAYAISMRCWTRTFHLSGYMQKFSWKAAWMPM